MKNRKPDTIDKKDNDFISSMTPKLRSYLYLFTGNINDVDDVLQDVFLKYLHKNLEPGSTYYYVLQAVAGADVSANSAEKSVVIPGEKKKVVIPPASRSSRPPCWIWTSAHHL